MFEEAPMEPRSATGSSGDEWPGGWPQTIEAFEQFVEVFQHRLVWNAFRRLGDRQEAEDAVQEVLLRTFADRARLGGVRNVRAYLYRMLANACCDRLRHRARRRHVISIEECQIEQIADDRAAAVEQVAAAEELERVERLLGQLPRRQAEVIRLKVLDELPLAEAAQVVGCTLATAKSRLRYGLTKLRRILTRQREEQR
jgi:RNA polymerase sigma-70 factor (ECF subfamily)